MTKAGICLSTGCVWAWLLVALPGCGASVEDRTTPAASHTATETNLPPGAKLLAVVSQAVHGVEECARTGELSLVHNESLIVNLAMAPFYSAPSNWPALPPGLDGDQFLTAFGHVREELSRMHNAGDRADKAEVDKRLPALREKFAAFQRLFPPATVSVAKTLAERYMCPMHPEVVGQRTGFCGKCSMELDQRVRLLPSEALQRAFEQAITMSARTDGPLRVGQPARVDVSLARTNGQPIEPTDLIEAHTQKIHLLIIDGSLEDYHHEHPTPTDKPGVYSFSFTPRKPGPYRVWADLRPAPIGVQEYVVTDIAAETQPGTLTNKSLNSTATVDGLKYELVLSSSKIRTGYPVEGKLRISNPDGSGFKKLEPIMATFAHLVGFNEDYKTVLHLHPKGAPITDANARGGPELEFQFYALQPGFVRLFAQVQIGGQSKFAPFGVVVTP
jgi:hypothetical protein